jgi:PAS domain S-box-containing protein
MSEKLRVFEECENESVRWAIDQLPAAYMELDIDGVVCCANRAARAMHDPALGDMIGQSAWALMPPDEQEPSRLAFEAVMRTGEAPSAVRRNVYTNLGEYRTYEVYRKLIMDREGHPAGMRLVSFDVTEQERVRQEAIQGREWMQAYWSR